LKRNITFETLTRIKKANYLKSLLATFFDAIFINKKSLAEIQYKA